ncbi:Clp protease adapter protein ClpF, chloroplastic [Glycine soja]
MAPFEPFKRSQITSSTGRNLVWNNSVQSLFLTRHSGFRAEAAWMFRGGEQGLDVSSEHSESANEDILMFFFQLDLATRVQYALNMEQYDIAKQLRNKLAEVEEEVIKQQQSKRGLSSKSEAQDKAISIIHLHSDLQNAIENEHYALAAELRDEISKLEAESLAASAKALAHENAQYAFRLGQKVRHKKFEQAIKLSSVEWIQYAVNQVHGWKMHKLKNCLVVPLNHFIRFLLMYMLNQIYWWHMGRFDHPYISFLFYGMDSAGDFIPIKQLREKYNKPRHEIPIDPPNDE